MNKQGFFWVLALLWCLTIYFFTNSPLSTGSSTGSFIRSIFSLPPETVRVINFLIRKGAHIASFGLLAVLLLIAFKKRKYAPIYAWALATLYGAFDEIHQSYTPGRTSLLNDVVIDSFGAMAAISLFLFIRSLVMRDKD